MYNKKRQVLVHNTWIRRHPQKHVTITQCVMLLSADPWDQACGGYTYTPSAAIDPRRCMCIQACPPACPPACPLACPPAFPLANPVANPLAALQPSRSGLAAFSKQPSRSGLAAFSKRPCSLLEAAFSKRPCSLLEAALIPGGHGGGGAKP